MIRHPHFVDIESRICLDPKCFNEKSEASQTRKRNPEDPKESDLAPKERVSQVATVAFLENPGGERFLYMQIFGTLRPGVCSRIFR